MKMLQILLHHPYKIYFKTQPYKYIFLNKNHTNVILMNEESILSYPYT